MGIREEVDAFEVSSKEPGRKARVRRRTSNLRIAYSVMKHLLNSILNIMLKIKLFVRLLTRSKL
jgi:hypothetical protein